MAIYHRLIENRFIPWRLRNRLEHWVETVCREHYEGLYRWMHLGSWAPAVVPLTTGPKHHFFGYYEKSPWDPSGRYVLAHEADFHDRAPTPDDAVSVGVIDLEQGPGFVPLGRSLAWNWQQGAMLQWFPGHETRRFVYNDRRKGRLLGVLALLDGSEEGTLERPVYAVMPDGSTAFSLNFARLAVHRPGYGYAGCVDPYANEPAPHKDGLWRLDLSSGQAALIVSLADLAARDRKPSMEGAWHYINHIQCSPGGVRIAFFHIWHGNGKGWEVRLYTCLPDGSDLRCLLDTGFISHYDWRDDDTLLVWAKRPDAPARFLIVSHRREGFTVFAEETVREDGHCSFSPDGRWVLNDTYPDKYQMRNLMLLQATTGRRIDIARLYSPKSRWWGEIRCDLHPRWHPDGRKVCIDSVHEGSRQMYLVDVSRWVA